MARTVEDVPRLMMVQAGRDERVPLSITGTWPPPAPLEQSPDRRRARIALLCNLDGYLAIEPGILELCEVALGPLADVGARVKP